jgi:hypothetical protein
VALRVLAGWASRRGRGCGLDWATRGGSGVGLGCWAGAWPGARGGGGGSRLASGPTLGWRAGEGQASAGALGYGARGRPRGDVLVGRGGARRRPPGKIGDGLAFLFSLFCFLFSILFYFLLNSTSNTNLRTT